MKFLGLFAAAAVAILTSNLASADTDVLNTGTPTGTGAPVELLGSTQFGVEFQLTGPATIDSISTYLTQGSASTGAAYEYFLYSGTALTRNSAAIDTAAELWGGTSGWNSSTVNWALSTGTYTLAIQSTSSGGALDLPLLASTTSGSTPALGWQDKSGSNWTATTTTTYGIEVTELSATPEPSAWALAFVGVGAFVYLRARRQKA